MPSKLYEEKLKGRRDNPEKYPHPEGWPEGVLWFSLADTDVLGFDADDNLYVNGKRVEVRETAISLQGWTLAAVVVGATSTLVLALIEAIRLAIELVNGTGGSLAPLP